MGRKVLHSCPRYCRPSEVTGTESNGRFSVFEPLLAQRAYMETTEYLDATEVHIQAQPLECHLGHQLLAGALTLRQAFTVSSHASIPSTLAARARHAPDHFRLRGYKKR